jgi:hypothetical protein
VRGGVSSNSSREREELLALSPIPFTQIKGHQEKEDWMERAPCIIFFGRGYDIDNNNGNTDKSMNVCMYIYTVIYCREREGKRAKWIEDTR